MAIQRDMDTFSKFSSRERMMTFVCMLMNHSDFYFAACDIWMQICRDTGTRGIYL